MANKKSKTKKPAKTAKKAEVKTKKISAAAKKVVKKPVKSPAKIKKKDQSKKVKKVAAKKLPKKADKKSTNKKPALKNTVKKESKNLKKAAAKEKASKIKEVKNNTKTSAKIIAKAKSNAKENKERASEIEESAIAEKKIEPQKSPIKKPENTQKVNFKINEYAVYPSHGVGKIVDIEKTLVLGQELSCYIMFFEKEKLNIKIPTNSAEKIGLRHLVSKAQMEEVFSILRSGVKKLKGMWSRRAQEYETKINSGDIILLAEVLRDLTRDIEDGERSYSERIIYETAVHRLAAEYAIIYGIDFEEAKEKVISTAKDKLGTEGKITQKDEFDEFDYDSEDSDEDEEDEDSEDEDEDEEGDEDDDDDYDYDDEDDEDEKPKRKRK